MAGSVNKVMLIGNLGADPEIKRTQAGDAIANLRIATSESWRDKNSGERREKTEWHQVVIFNEGLVKVAEQYLKKGAKVYVEGQLQTRSWDDQSGQKRYATEVVLQRFRGELQMLDGRGDVEGRGEGRSQPQERGQDARGGYGRDDRSSGGSRSTGSYGADKGRAAPGPRTDDFADDIPF